MPPHIPPPIMNKRPIAIITKLALFATACCAPCGAQGTVVISAAAPPVAANVAWTSATYDANGYPIYGYSYGQAVYGYTEAGVAITTIAALTALSFIPDWGPATWYRGPVYAPRGHRYAQPPRYAHGHRPANRPQHRPSAAPHGSPRSHGGGHRSHGGGGGHGHR